MFCRDITQRPRHAVCTAKEEERGKQREAKSRWLANENCDQNGLGPYRKQNKNQCAVVIQRTAHVRELMNEEEKRGLLTINTNSAHICRQEQCILVEVTLSYFPSIKKKKLLSCGKERTKTSLSWLCWSDVKKKKVLNSCHTIVFVSTYFQSFKIWSPCVCLHV